MALTVQDKAAIVAQHARAPGDTGSHAAVSSAW